MGKPDHVSQEWWDKKEDEKATQRLRGEEYTLAREAIRRKHAGKEKCACGTGWYGNNTWCGTCGKVVEVIYHKLRRPRVVNGSKLWKMPICKECGTRPWGNCPECGGVGYRASAGEDSE